MYLDIWQVILLLVGFAFAIWKTSSKFYDSGYVDGSVEAIMPSTDEYVSKVIAMLEQEGIVETKEMPDGQLRITPGTGKKKGA